MIWCINRTHKTNYECNSDIFLFDPLKPKLNECFWTPIGKYPFHTSTPLLHLIGVQKCCAKYVQKVIHLMLLFKVQHSFEWILSIFVGLWSHYVIGSCMDETILHTQIDCIELWIIYNWETMNHILYFNDRMCHCIFWHLYWNFVWVYSSGSYRQQARICLVPIWYMYHALW